MIMFRKILCFLGIHSLKKNESLLASIGVCPECLRVANWHAYKKALREDTQLIYKSFQLPLNPTCVVCGKNEIHTHFF